MSKASATDNKRPIGTYSIDNGGTVSIKQGYALDFSLMKASQLNGLLEIMMAPGFSACSEIGKADCLCLAADLAKEVKNLFEVVAADAKQEPPHAVSSPQ